MRRKKLEVKWRQLPWKSSSRSQQTIKLLSLNLLTGLPSSLSLFSRVDQVYTLEVNWTALDGEWIEWFTVNAFECYNACSDDLNFTTYWFTSYSNLHRVVKTIETTIGSSNDILDALNTLTNEQPSIIHEEDRSFGMYTRLEPSSFKPSTSSYCRPEDSHCYCQGDAQILS